MQYAGNAICDRLNFKIIKGDRSNASKTTHCHQKDFLKTVEAV